MLEEVRIDGIMGVIKRVIDTQKYLYEEGLKEEINYTQELSKEIIQLIKKHIPDVRFEFLPLSLFICLMTLINMPIEEVKKCGCSGETKCNKHNNPNPKNVLPFTKKSKKEKRKEV